MSHRRNNTTTATATTTTTNTHATRRAAQAPATQRSYIVSIDTGSFANVEIVVGNYHHRAGAGVWTPSPSRSNSVKVVTRKSSHVYTSYVPTTLPPTSPTTKRTPFTPVQSQPASAARSHTSSSTSASDTRSKRTYDERRDKSRDYIAATHHHHLADERARAHLQRQRQREREEEEARRRQQQQQLAEAEAEARRVAAAAKEARRRQRLAEQQRHEDQKRQQQQQRALREDRKRLERTRRAREIANAWNSYETRWAVLSQSQNQRRHHLSGALTSLTFEQIPWPVTDSEQVTTTPPPLDGRRITTTTRRAPAPDMLLRLEAIREFLLSPAHSPEVSSKDRIRTALRRWHPDKFARVLSLVVESDRDAVADGVGIVARCLNEMLERENQA